MKLNAVAKNSAWIIGCKLIEAVLALVVSLLTARYLGPSNYGLMNYAASITAFVLPIVHLGLTSILVNELVKAPQNEGEILGTSLLLMGLSSLLCILGVVCFTAISNAGESITILVCFLYSLMLLFQGMEVLQCWFQARLQSKYVSIVTLFAYVVVSVYKILLLAKGKSVQWFALSYSIDYILILGALLLVYDKHGGKKLRFSKDIAKRLLSVGRYYILSNMMIVLFQQTDRIMLKHMEGNSAVGYYSAAVTIAGMTYFVFTAIITSFRPVILSCSKQERNLFEEQMSTLFSIVFYLSLAQCLLMTLGAKWLVPMMYGEKYSSTITALQIIVWYITFSYFGAIRNIWILAEGKERVLWVLNLSGAVGNITLNYVMIPLWGINGAALASLLTQVFANVVLNFVIKPIRPVNRLMLRGINPKRLRLLYTTLFKKDT